MINLAGKKFERLTVLEETTRSKTNIRRWLCECECGNISTVHQAALTSGNTKSCGCLNLEAIGNRKRLHGKSNTAQYKAWKTMKARCKNPKHIQFKDYGGRGITYCDRWESFENFYEDMGPKPSQKHSLDRINSSENYCLENCRWATSRQQNSNSRKNKNGLPLGVFFNSRNQYISKITKDKKVYRLGTFDTAEAAAKAYDDECQKFGEGRPNGT